MTEAEIAALKAAGERIKKPFRPDPTSWELSRDRAEWESRRATVRALLDVMSAAFNLDEALADLDRQPQGPLDESEADKELANLWCAMRAFFPGVTIS